MFVQNMCFRSTVNSQYVNNRRNLLAVRIGLYTKVLPFYFTQHFGLISCRPSREGLTPQGGRNCAFFGPTLFLEHDLTVRRAPAVWQAAVGQRVLLNYGTDSPTWVQLPHREKPEAPSLSGSSYMRGLTGVDRAQGPCVNVAGTSLEVAHMLAEWSMGLDEACHSSSHLCSLAEVSQRRRELVDY